MRRPLPSVEDLRALFDYDPETGDLTRRSLGRSACIRYRDYWRVFVPGGARYFPAHRVAWKMATGEEPYEVDHRNGDKRDNRLANLRAAEAVENRRNKRLTKASTSGLKGVSLHRRTGRWGAYIMVNRKSKYLGLFDTPEEAHAAYCDAARELHGEFWSDGK